MYKSILFDLGGVLFTNGTKKFTSYLHTKYQLDENTIKNVIDAGEIPDAYREGKIGRNEFWAKVRSELNLSEDIDVLEREWINGYNLIAETRDIIFELSKKYKVYFLSDNVKERVEALNNKFNFLIWFESGVFSHEAGIRKPNKRIYELSLQKIQTKPEEVIFIDDKESAIKPAAQLGMSTILFISPEDLREKLGILKVL